MKDHGQRGDWIYQTIEDPENKTNLDRFIEYRCCHFENNSKRT